MYDTAHITYDSKAGAAKDVIRALKKSWPGEVSESSDLILRWGQNTPLTPGKTLVIFDMGYFGRNAKDPNDRHFRLSINEYHPTRLPSAPADRWELLGLDLKDYFDPDGHILLIGTGKKARIKNTGSAKPIWSTKALKKLQDTYPGKTIVYRPKINTPGESFPGIVTDYDSSIEDLCRGCSLVYTEHSNVGNEALRYGLPVVTEGGPASDICPSELPEDPRPLPERTREDFLHRLAYWQWSINEIRRGDMWPWLFEQIEARGCI